MSKVAASTKSEGLGVAIVVPAKRGTSPLPLRSRPRRSSQPATRPIVRPIHPCTDYLEAFLLPQGHDAALPARDPVVHVSGSDPVVPQLNLHDFEYPPDVMMRDLPVSASPSHRARVPETQLENPS